MHEQEVCFPNVEQWISDSCALDNVLKLLMLHEKVNEYDQEIQQSHAADQPTAP